MDINTLVLCASIALPAGFIIGFVIGLFLHKRDCGTITFDTRNDAGIDCHIVFDRRPEELMLRKELIFKVDVK